MNNATVRALLRLAGGLGIVCIALMDSCLGSPAVPYRQVYGAQGYDSSTGTGFLNPVGWSRVNAGGLAVGTARKFSPTGDLGPRAVRWDGTSAIELAHLGTDANGATNSQASSVNDNGIVVGYSAKYTPSGVYRGDIAVRWDASGTVATELGSLGIGLGDIIEAYAVDINDGGTVAGSARKFDSTGFYRGTRAVRWQSTGTAATELGHLGFDAGGFADSYGYALNNLGTVVGTSEKMQAGISLGGRAVRWDANSTLATELGHLGADSNGSTYAVANDVNDSGTSIGLTFKYVSGTYVGQVAVRWDGTGTVATDLGHLGTNSNGVGLSYASAINQNGTAIGTSTKYVAGVDLGLRAVRWSSTSTTPTELGHLGTSSNGVTHCETLALNENDLIVGSAYKYVGGVSAGTRAVVWRQNNKAVDLNAFVDPSSGWLLTEATSISDTGWISGIGQFDPDGPGGEDAYTRMFTIHVPEPNSFAIMMASGSLLFRRRASVPLHFAGASCRG